QVGQAGEHLKLAPNGKIYFFSPNSGLPTMGLIDAPNLSGSACGFMSNAITLFNTYGALSGLPNVVPVIRKDTSFTTQQQSAGCFASQTAVSALDDSTGWDYLWNTGVTGKEILADTPGTYWVTYHT